jgi:hypothetical protein
LDKTQYILDTPSARVNDASHSPLPGTYSGISTYQQFQEAMHAFAFQYQLDKDVETVTNGQIKSWNQLMQEFSGGGHTSNSNIESPGTGAGSATATSGTVGKKEDRPRGKKKEVGWTEAKKNKLFQQLDRLRLERKERAAMNFTGEEEFSLDYEIGADEGEQGIKEMARYANKLCL